MTIGGGGDSWLLRILNRIFRCSHQRQTRPITPRGGGQTYAVCLDCGMRLSYDLSVMGVLTSVHRSSLASQRSEVRKEKVLDISADGSIPAAPERRQTTWADSRRVNRDSGTPAVLWIGAMSLAGGLVYLLDQPAGPRNPTVPKQVRPPLSTRSVKSLRSLPVEEPEREKEVAPAHEISTPASPTFSTEPNSLNKTIEPDSNSTSAVPQPDQSPRLDGKGPIVVLGREAGAALELSQHPERLSKLIEGGSLFTVPHGTAIKLLQVNRLGNSFVIKVQVMEGSMAGQEGWAQPEQPRSPSADWAKSSPGLPTQERGTEVAPYPQAAKPVAYATPSKQPTSATGGKTTAPDSASRSAAPQPDQIPRLEGKGLVVVLGREAGAALELSQHPERLSKLIEGGSVFTVPRGTMIKLLEGNRLGDRFVIKVRIMEGSKVGQEGWAQPSQVSR
jgi:hypothetical protein